MKEQELYEALVKRQIVDDEAIKRYARAAEPKRSVGFVRVLKPVGIALAALLLAFGVTMAIPASRAEVMRWFRPTSAQEYISQPSEEREPNGELDAMIVPGEQSETNVSVGYASEESIWTEIADHLDSVELGDTMFDGRSLYIRMRMDGIAALADIESLTGGNLTKHVIPPEDTPAYFEDYHTPAEFLSGELPFWADTAVFATFTFADGTKIEGGSFVVDDADIRPLMDSLNRDDLIQGNYATPEQFKEINARELAYLKDRTVGVLYTTSLSDYHLVYNYPELCRENRERTLLDLFRDNADENGRTTVTVGMVILEDCGDGPEEIVLDAALGTVTVDLEAYKSLKKAELKPGTEAVFAPEEAVFSLEDWPKDENGVPYCTVTNLPVNLDGLTLKPQEGAYIDALGVQNLRITLAAPKSWDRRILEALNGLELYFDVLINGELIGSLSGLHMERYENGTVTIVIDSITNVPLDLLSEVKTVTLIPKLSHFTAMKVRAEGENGIPGEVISETVFEPGVTYSLGRQPGGWVFETTDYPQYAITFSVK